MKLMTILGLSFLLFSLTCGEPEVQQESQEVETGLEEDAPASQEVDTLQEKMNKMMEDTQKE